MSNNTTTPAKTRRPSAASMRAALKKAGRPVADDATPKQLVVAFEAWVADGKPAAATPAKPKTAKPAAKTPVKAEPKAPANCGCGCGAPTITTKATFLPGHDARLAGVLGRAIGEGTITADQQAQLDALTDALKAKVEKIAETARAKAAIKKAKADAKAAYEAALAAIG